MKCAEIHPYLMSGQVCGGCGLSKKELTQMQFSISQQQLGRREYFSAMAMQGMTLIRMDEYSTNDLEKGMPQAHGKWIAQMAVIYADALIAELEKE